MTTPAPTPAEKTLKRVLVIAAFDGWSLIIVAGLSLLLTLLLVEPVGIVLSLLVLTAGMIEFRGRRALKNSDAETGMKLLVRSQLFLLAVILIYCARSIGSFDADYVKEQVIPAVSDMYQSLLGINLAEYLQQAGLTVADLVPLAHKAFLILYGSVAFISTLYQGGMAWYYRSRTRLVTEALTPRPQETNYSVL